jgi:two-component sensor histidine kinase
MTKDLAQFLKDASKHNGVEEEVTIYENYSGRGMFGRETNGVVVANIPELLLNAIKYAKESVENGNMAIIPDVSGEGQLRTDNMGRSTILY